MTSPEPERPRGDGGEPDTSVVDGLFDRLLDLTRDERQGALDACGESEAVIERVRELLALTEGPQPELDRPLVSAAIVEAAARPERIGPYDVLELIGVGAMGVVYRARQQRPQRDVALKLVRAALDADQAARRFEREAELLGRLQHPGIAQIFESGTADLAIGPTAYIAMELVEGQTLGDHARAAGLDLRARVQLLVALADAVHHAHLRGVLHRDLKPSNVLVTTDGAVKVIDFGVARALDAEGDALRATAAGHVVGTLAYMSPEQVVGDLLALDARTDVYSLGVLTYELLSERLPLDLEDTTLAVAARRIVEDDVRPLSSVAPACRGDLDAITGQALAKDPRHRYQSADAFAKDLRRWLNDEPVEARSAGSLYHLQRIARRHRVAALGLAATLTAIVVGGGVATHFAIANARLATSEADAREDAQRLEALATERAVEAERLYRVSEERAAEIIRRTDPDTLDRAIRGAADLWPAVPATVPVIDAWLRELGEPLEASLSNHRATLADWRRSALPYSDELRARDRATHPLLPDLEWARGDLESAHATLAGLSPVMPVLGERERTIVEKSQGDIERRVEELEATVNERRTWEFVDPDLQEAHDSLTRLVGRLEEFVDPDDGLLTEVRERRAAAIELEPMTVSGPDAAAAWERARAAIREHPRYAGLDLPSQIGLLPLREDPRSGLWEFLHVRSGRTPVSSTEPDATSTWIPDAEMGIVLVLIPGGRYRVGAQSSDPDAPHFDAAAAPIEGPAREVDLAPFFIAKFEMTIRQWDRVVGTSTNGYIETFTWFGVPPGDEPLHVNTFWNPVDRVSWTQAADGLRRGDLQLPSGVEWEVAARAGTETPWWTGRAADSIGGADGLPPAGNLADALTRERGGPDFFPYEEWDDGWIVHAPVGTFPPNPFGLHDTIGNVFELCRDRNLPDTDDSVITVRGGAFSEGAENARVSKAGFIYDSEQNTKVGLRPARRVDGL